MTSNQKWVRIRNGRFPRWRGIFVLYLPKGIYQSPIQVIRFKKLRFHAFFMSKKDNIQILHQPRDIDFVELNSFSQAQQYHNGLRDYQQQNKAAIYKEWGRGSTNIMLQMPTGTGKTHLFASIIKDLQDYFFKKACEAHLKSWEERQRWALPKILVLVHRIELIEQIHDTLAEKYKHTSGIVSGGMIMGETKNVIVASVQTLSRRKKLDKWEKDVNFDFIIIDEAHHSTADSYRRIRSAWPDARLLGVTATPYRLNHQPFTDVYDKLILSEPVYKFIEKGYLCQYDYCSIKPNSQIQYEIDHLATDFSGDYDEQAMVNLLNQDRIRASILGTYEKFAKGKKGIVYTINRLHNQMLAGLFESHGYKVAYIDSQTPKEERNQTVDAFRKGEIEIIFNVNIFSEGFDCPDVEFIQLARPTKSLSMYLQQVGRGFRIAEGKEKVIFLDNVGLYNRFGLPSARRAWQHYFEGREDWEEEKGVENGSLGEPHDTGADLSEGNEDVSLIFTSTSQPWEENQTQTEIGFVETIDSIEPSQKNDQQETNTEMDNETIIICKNQKYVVEDLSQKEMAEMLLLIEDVCKTGMIDVEALKRTIKSLDEERRRAMEQFIANSGYSKEELLAVLTNHDLDITQNILSETTSVYNKKGLYVVTDEGKAIQESTSRRTYVSAIKAIGAKRVYVAWKLIGFRKGGMTKGYQINPDWVPIEDNGADIYYLYVNIKNDSMLERLQWVNRQLGLGWTIGFNGIGEAFLNQHETNTDGGNVSEKGKGLSKGLYVIRKDGSIIQESTGSNTLLKAIQEIGLKRVYSTCWTIQWTQIETMHKLITKFAYACNSNKNVYELDENGVIYYIDTKTDTPTKMLQLRNLSGKLNLGWTIGIEGGDEKTQSVLIQDEVIRPGLYVKDAKGKVIQETTASKTILKAIKTIGVKRVYQICSTSHWWDMEIMRGLISTEPNPRYATRSGEHVLTEDGVNYYVITNSNTQTKMRQLRNLSKALNLSWTVEIEGGNQ